MNVSPSGTGNYSLCDESDNLISFLDDSTSSNQNPPPNFLQPKQPSRFTIRKEKRGINSFNERLKIPSSIPIPLSNENHVGSFPTSPNFLTPKSQVFQVTHTAQKMQRSADETLNAKTSGTDNLNIRKIEIEISISPHSEHPPPSTQNTSDYDDLINFLF